MRILVTNDDGIAAEGIRVLAKVASRFGETKVVAPDRERSACAHGMTLRDPLRVRSSPLDGLEAYEVNGLPVDCVNVGLALAWPDGCDLVLSGMNNGPNLGFDATYSGTVAGAMEGAMNGVPSIALSMCVFAEGAPYHYETGASWLIENWEWIVGVAREENVFWNVNVPAIAWPEVVGTRVVRMGRRVYEDRLERREDPWGKTYFWQGGVVVMQRDEPDTDIGAVCSGFVAATPMTIDWTAESSLSRYASLKPSAQR